MPEKLPTPVPDALASIVMLPFIVESDTPEVTLTLRPASTSIAPLPVVVTLALMVTSSAAESVTLSLALTEPFTLIASAFTSIDRMVSAVSRVTVSVPPSPSMFTLKALPGARLEPIVMESSPAPALI